MKRGFTVALSPNNVRRMTWLDVGRNRPRSKWGEYFYSIKQQCPWSYSAWLQGQIDIVAWQGKVIPLGQYQARMYTVNTSNKIVESMCEELDEGEYEWLFSYPEYGEHATPETVLIQQSRAVLKRLRDKQ